MYGVSKQQIHDLIEAGRDMADLFEELAAWQGVGEGLVRYQWYHLCATFLLGPVLSLLNEQKIEVRDWMVSTPRLQGLLLLVHRQWITPSTAKKVLHRMEGGEQAAWEIVRDENLLTVKEPAVLGPIIDQVIEDSPADVDKWLSGKARIVDAFIGRVMRACPGPADAEQVRSMVEERLARVRDATAPPENP